MKWLVSWSSEPDTVSELCGAPTAYINSTLIAGIEAWLETTGESDG